MSTPIKREIPPLRRPKSATKPESDKPATPGTNAVTEEVDPPQTTTQTPSTSRRTDPFVNVEEPGESGKDKGNGATPKKPGT